MAQNAFQVQQVPNLQQVSDSTNKGYVLKHGEATMFDNIQNGLQKTTERHSLIELSRKYVGNLASKSILDLPCGTGNLACQYLDEGIGFIACLDISPEMVELTSANLSRRSHSNYLVSYADAYDKQSILSAVGDRKFDVIVNQWLYTYCETSEQLRNMLINQLELLSPDGVFIFTISNNDVGGLTKVPAQNDRVLGAYVLYDYEQNKRRYCWYMEDDEIVSFQSNLHPKAFYTDVFDQIGFEAIQENYIPRPEHRELFENEGISSYLTPNSFDLILVARRKQDNQSQIFEHLKG